MSSRQAHSGNPIRTHAGAHKHRHRQADTQARTLRGTCERRPCTSAGQHARAHAHAQALTHMLKHGWRVCTSAQARAHACGCTRNVVGEHAGTAIRVQACEST
eukprot:11103598-Alexandrium_andersonii.AAC.1